MRIPPFKNYENNSDFVIITAPKEYFFGVLSL